MGLILLTLFFKWVSRLGSDFCLFPLMRNKEPQLVSLSVAIYLFLSCQVAAMFVLICLCLYSVAVFKAMGWLLSYVRVSWRLLLSCRASLTSCLEGQWRADVQIKHWRVKGENKQFLNAYTHIFCIVKKNWSVATHTPHTVFLKFETVATCSNKKITGWKILLDTVSETKKNLLFINVLLIVKVQRFQPFFKNIFLWSLWKNPLNGIHGIF